MEFPAVLGAFLRTWQHLPSDTAITAIHNYPGPPILAFFVFLAFFRFVIILAFLCVFALFPKDFKGSAEGGKSSLFSGVPRFLIWLSSRTRPVKNFGIFHYFWVFFRFVICRVVPRNANSWVQPLLLEGQRVNPCERFPYRPATNLPHVMVSACFNQSSTKNGVHEIL